MIFFSPFLKDERPTSKHAKAWSLAQRRRLRRVPLLKLF